MERAAELFAARGIAGTSLDEVLAAAGAGKGQFYHYFRSRDELAAAAVGYRCAQVIAELSQALGEVSSLAGLEQALAGFAAGFEQLGMPGCPIGTLATEVAGRNEDARLQAAAGFDAWERLLARPPHPGHHDRRAGAGHGSRASRIGSRPARELAAVQAASNWPAG